MTDPFRRQLSHIWHREAPKQYRKVFAWRNAYRVCIRCKRDNSGMIRFTMTHVDARIAKRLKEIPDPLGVRASTAEVLGWPRFVRLDPAGLRRATELIRQRIRTKRLLTHDQFGSRQVGPQRVFLLDAINFCFWAPRGKRRWEVQYPKGKRLNGWYALAACFERALAEGVPILSAAFLARLSLDGARHIFRGVDGRVPIPLLAKRHRFLKSAGTILSRHFRGSIERLIDQAGPDAAELAKATIESFPFFEDAAVVDGKRVALYKRAQIFVYDLSLIPGSGIRSLEALTAFADYKLPQLLRHLGAVRYREDLARRVDGKTILGKGSRKEVEIRAATVWACELIADELGVPAVVVDNALWLAATKSTYSMKPYHRTLTTCY